MVGGASIRTLEREELTTVLDWAAAEGWNPGLHDADAFHAADPAGFFGLFIDGELVATVSLVRYDELFVFVGCYICRPDHRGRGLGLTLFESALARADSATIGLDAVLEQERNYARQAFVTAHRNVRYAGEPRIDIADDRRVRRITIDDVAAVQRYERASFVFPSPRAAFLERWIGAPGATALAVGDGPDGYGVIRECRSGNKIGPLFCADRTTAECLVAALTMSRGGGAVFLDVPEPNETAVAMAVDLGLQPTFETARMYRGPSPQLDLQRIFGITTFELG